MAFVDEGRIQQVVTNLLSNAIKYSNINGMVRAAVEDGKEIVVMGVEDDGIGIGKNTRN